MRRSAAWLVAGALAGALACAPGPTPPAADGSAVLPFVENDYSEALRRAREAGLPLFVEVWAPW